MRVAVQIVQTNRACAPPNFRWVGFTGYGGPSFRASVLARWLRMRHVEVLIRDDGFGLTIYAPDHEPEGNGKRCGEALVALDRACQRRRFRPKS